MEQLPQLEDGYTRLANELLEAIMGLGFTQRQLLVVLAVIRKTYGYGKKQDDMSASQIGQLCNMERNHVTEVIGQLVQMQVLTRAPGSYGLVLGINKRHKQWIKPDARKPRTSPNLGLVLTRDKSSPNLGQVDSPNLGHTKENLSKENQKKGSRPEICFADWIEKVREEGGKPIAEDHAVFAYAAKINLPLNYLRLCWLEFRREHFDRRDKKQKDWPGTFAVYVRKNYYRLWFKKNNEWQLTTAGLQLEDEMRDEK